MTANQPPLYPTSFDTQSLSTSPSTVTVPISTPVGQEASTADPRTGPAPTTAGPHRTDMANRLDPRVDSDLNNRAQYAPGATISGNVHPGTTQRASNPESSNEGPHRTALYNKLDLRVDSKTGNMTTKTTNKGGSGAARAPTDTSGRGLSNPSSVTAAVDPGIEDTTARSAYDPSRTRYNPSTGSGYNATSPTRYSQHYQAQYAPSTTGTQPRDSLSAAPESSVGSSGKSETVGDKLGGGMKSIVAGIHGAGEMVRGSLASAVDKASGHKESAAKNEAIAAEGEQEIQSGRLSCHQSEEGSNK